MDVRKGLKELNRVFKALSMYPRGHPSLKSPMKMMFDAINEIVEEVGIIDIGVTPKGFLLADEVIDVPLAVHLHKRNIVLLSIAEGVTMEGLREALEVMAFEDGSIEARLREKKVTGISVKEVPYLEILEKEEGIAVSETVDLWKSIIFKYLSGDSEDIGIEEEKFLLTLATNLDMMQEFIRYLLKKTEGKEIVEMSSKLSEAFERIYSSVSIINKAFLPSALKNIVEVTSMLDPDMRYHLLTSGGTIIDKMTSYLTDDMVVDVVVSILAREGKVTDRLLRVVKSVTSVENVSEAAKKRVDKKFWDIINELFFRVKEEHFISAEYMKSLEELSDITLTEEIALDDKYIKTIKKDSIMEQRILFLVDLIHMDEKDATLRLEEIFEESVLSGDYVQAERVRGLLIDLFPSDQAFLYRISKDEVIKELIAALCDTDKRYFDKISSIIINIGLPTVPLLIDVLINEKNRWVRWAVLDMLLRMGRVILPEVYSHLSDNRWYVVRNMVHLIGKIGDDEGVKHLKDCLRHEDIRIKREAIKAMGSIGGESVIKTLLLLLKDKDLMAQVIQTLGDMRAIESVPLLREILLQESLLFASKYDDIRKMAAKALGKIRTVDAIETLKNGSISKRDAIKHACLDALKGIT
ncbi:MAG: HEAT repeat domain-containing protein [Nitrospirota bacterium]